jgi:hypothetical protein
VVEHKGEKILLVTVHNPLYPITIDVITSIMKPFKVSSFLFVWLRVTMTMTMTMTMTITLTVMIND